MGGLGVLCGGGIAPGGKYVLKAEPAGRFYGRLDEKLAKGMILRYTIN